MQIAIFHKASEVKYAPKASAKTLAPMMNMILAKFRVKRESVLALFLPSANGRSIFARMPVVTRSELHHLADCRRNGVMTDEADVTLSKAWIVPADEYGRKVPVTEDDYASTAQSILLWCKSVGKYSLSESDLFTVDPLGSDISVIVID